MLLETLSQWITLHSTRTQRPELNFYNQPLVDAENIVAENVTEQAEKPPKPSWLNTIEDNDHLQGRVKT